MCLDVHRITVWKPVPIQRDPRAHLSQPAINIELPPSVLTEIAPARAPTYPFAPFPSFFSTRPRWVSSFSSSRRPPETAAGRRRDLDGGEGNSTIYFVPDPILYCRLVGNLSFLSIPPMAPPSSPSNGGPSSAENPTPSASSHGCVPFPPYLSPMAPPPLLCSMSTPFFPLPLRYLPSHGAPSAHPISPSTTPLPWLLPSPLPLMDFPFLLPPMVVFPIFINRRTSARSNLLTLSLILYVNHRGSSILQ